MFGLFVRGDFAERHADAVMRYVRANVEINREMRADPQRLVRAALDGEPGGDADATARAVEHYLSANIWDANGGLTDAKVGFTLRFLAQFGGAGADVDARRIADLSYVNATLAAIGRR
jgi:ABC-type nitrate/sulfonate/bicarbonate transport system substrate-binding protein